MVQSSPARLYERRDPERSVLHRVVREHLETFLALTASRDPDGQGLPTFVERELRSFLECNVLAHGFARFRCESCQTDRLVAFSCRGRGFCPSCGGRRMTAQAAHLVDRVIPHVPIRQWVLSFPFALRRRLAFDHRLCRAVLRVFNRALAGFYRKRARVAGGRTGTVTAIQRFGSALNLNPHFHTLSMDGVFTENQDGSLDFHAQPPPTDEDVGRLLATIHHRITRLLIRRGVWNEDRELDEDTSDDPSLLEHLQAASIKQLALTGPRAGQPIQRLGTGLAIPAGLGQLGPRRARLEGFDLHADTAVRAHSRKRLEHLCTYLLRPPISESRLELRRGKVRLQLKTAWRDGSTHLELEPTELLERLAALVPLPHKNLLVYHGVFAANARWRSRVVAFGRPQEPASRVDTCDHDPTSAAPATEPPPTRRHRPNPTWAELMRRGLDIDALDCPKCHGRMKFIAAITSPRIIARILTHLGLPSDPIRPAPARGPPSLDDDCIDVA